MVHLKPIFTRQSCTQSDGQTSVICSRYTRVRYGDIQLLKLLILLLFYCYFILVKYKSTKFVFSVKELQIRGWDNMATAATLWLWFPVTASSQTPKFDWLINGSVFYRSRITDWIWLDKWQLELHTSCFRSFAVRMIR